MCIRPVTHCSDQGQSTDIYGTAALETSSEQTIKITL